MSILQQISTPEFDQYMASVGTMKPAKVDRENAKQVAKLDKLMDDPNYVAEDKIDGCHYKMFGCRFASTSNVEKTHNYPHLRDFFDNLGFANIITDGEIYYPGKTSQDCTPVTGSSSENAVAYQEQNGYIHYKLFDILRTPRGAWLLNKTYEERRAILEFFYNRYIVGTEIEPYITLTQCRSDKRALLAEIEEIDGEGIILKRKASVYVMNKKPAWQWVKIKKHDTTDLFIIGYISPEKVYTGKKLDTWEYWMEEENGEMVPVSENYYKGLIGSIKLGAYDRNDPDRIIEVCSVSGFDMELRKQISANKEAYIDRVVVVDYMEKTNAGFPRHPDFKEFHDGKRKEECVWPDKEISDAYNNDIDDDDDENEDNE